MKKNLSIALGLAGSVICAASLIPVIIYATRKNSTPTNYIINNMGKGHVVIPTVSVTSFTTPTPVAVDGFFTYDSKERSEITMVALNGPTFMDPLWHISLESNDANYLKTLNFSSEEATENAFNKFFADDSYFFYSAHTKTCLSKSEYVDHIEQKIITDKETDIPLSVFEKFYFKAPEGCDSGTEMVWAYYPSSASDMKELCEFNQTYSDFIINS